MILEYSEDDVTNEYNVLSIDKNTSCQKILNIFINMDIWLLYVSDETGVIGFITKKEFLKFNTDSINSII